jgi:hypothetical protein
VGFRLFVNELGSNLHTTKRNSTEARLGKLAGFITIPVIDSNVVWRLRHQLSIDAVTILGAKAEETATAVANNANDFVLISGLHIVIMLTYIHLSVKTFYGDFFSFWVFDNELSQRNFNLLADHFFNISGVLIFII